jgi:hypothetical protein
MCDVCNILGTNPAILNGKKPHKLTVTIYRAHNGSRPMLLKLCYVHSIDLFLVGEGRFFEIYPQLRVAMRGGGDGSSGDGLSWAA